MSKAHHKGATAPEAAPAASIETEADPASEVVLEAPAQDSVVVPEDPADLREWVVSMLTGAAEAFKKVHDDGIAEARAVFSEQVDAFAKSFTAAINEVGEHVAVIEQRLAGEGSMVAEVQSIKASLARVVDALGRQDLLTPQASAEQLEAALAKGQCRVKVLADYSTLKFTVKAGRVLDSQSSDHRALLDGVRSGKLKVSLLPPE